LFIVVLYTVTVLNECQQAATDVKLLDEVHISAPGIAWFIALVAPVVADPSGKLCHLACPHRVVRFWS
jgi:hypothetical protein